MTTTTTSTTSTTTTTGPSLSLVVYPTVGYNTWISEADADDYLAARLHADEWDALASLQKQVSLLHAFRSLQELDLDIKWKVNPTTGHKELADGYTALQKADILIILKNAQAEQALHLVKFDPEEIRLKGFDLGSGMISATMDPDSNPPRFTISAINILAPILRRPSVKRFR